VINLLSTTNQLNNLDLEAATDLLPETSQAIDINSEFSEFLDTEISLELPEMVEGLEIGDLSAPQLLQAEDLEDNTEHLLPPFAAKVAGMTEDFRVTDEELAAMTDTPLNGPSELLAKLVPPTTGVLEETRIRTDSAIVKLAPVTQGDKELSGVAINNDDSLLFDKVVNDSDIIKSREISAIQLTENTAQQVKSDLLNLRVENQSNLNIAQHGVTNNQTHQSSAPANLSVNVPINNPAWGENMAGKISWMIMENQHSAKISVNPAELGPIDVKIKMDNDQATISIMAQHAEVRDAIEQSLSRLREMLSQNGINLGDSHVSANGDESDTQSTHSADTEFSGQNEIQTEDESISLVSRISRSLIDQFV
jgi:flagellar hook-length control protein FliK